MTKCIIGLLSVFKNINSFHSSLQDKYFTELISKPNGNCLPSVFVILLTWVLELCHTTNIK